MNKDTPMKLTFLSIIISSLWIIRFTDIMRALYIVVILNMIGYILMFREYKQQEAREC